MRQQTPLLSVGDVALRLRQSPWTIRAKVRDGTLPALRIGNGPRAPIRIDPAELEAWLDGHLASSPKPPASEAAPPGVGALARAHELPDLPRTG